jgi:hypothetical protein
MNWNRVELEAASQIVRPPVLIHESLSGPLSKRFRVNNGPWVVSNKRPAVRLHSLIGPSLRGRLHPSIRGRKPRVTVRDNRSTLPR